MVIIYSRLFLEQVGLEVNPNMWLGGGWFYCAFCKEYTHHYAMSHKGQSDCFEICKKCDSYSGNKNPVTENSLIEGLKND
jgi:hypothetical protein